MNQIRGVEKNDLNMSSDNTIKNEVKNLLKEGFKLDGNTITHLRKKYNDEAVIKLIYDEFEERKKNIVSIADDFVEKFIKKHGMGNTLHSILDKAILYKKKYNLSEEEYEEVKKKFTEKIYNISGNMTNYNTTNNHNTNMSRAFGHEYSAVNDGIKTSSPEDYQYIQGTINNHTITRPLHSQLLLQTMTYKPFENINLMFNTFDRNKHNPAHAINAVIVALFFPKIDILERRMIYSDFTKIVKSKFEKMSLMTMPDAELLESIKNDPSDIVCSSVSPIKDIHDRAIVQIQLWNNIYNLRNGKFFDSVGFEFLNTINNCKINNYDNPNMIMLNDEGVILKRLFSVFSFRPISIHTLPIPNNGLNMNPFNFSTIIKVTNLPFIFHRPSTVNTKLSLEDNRINYFIENNNFVPKINKVHSVVGPVVFYVPRKAVNVPIVQPFYMKNLPLTNLTTNNNDYTEVNYESHIRINNQETKKLRTVVTLNILDTNDTKIVNGNNVMIFNYSDDSIVDDMFSEPNQVYNYTPQLVLNPEYNNSVINLIDYNDEAKTLCKKNGTIFVYN